MIVPVEAQSDKHFVSLSLFLSHPLNSDVTSLSTNLIKYVLFVSLSHYHLQFCSRYPSLSQKDPLVMWLPWGQQPNLITKSGQPCGQCWAFSQQTLHMQTLYSSHSHTGLVNQKRGKHSALSVGEVHRAEGGRGGRLQDQLQGREGERGSAVPRSKHNSLNGWSKRSVSISSALALELASSTGRYDTQGSSQLCPQYVSDCCFELHLRLCCPSGVSCEILRKINIFSTSPVYTYLKG